MRRDEVEAAWRWVEPILEAWAASDGAAQALSRRHAGDPPPPIALIERDGRTWLEEAH